MRLLALVMLSLLVAAPAPAQQAERSSSADLRSSSEDAARGASGESASLPVSLERIRFALEREPSRILTGLGEQPRFYAEIRERQRIADLVSTLTFKSGPVPPGGLYTYEQQRNVFPPSAYPLRQPYAAFSQGELLTLLVENLAGKYLVGHVVESITAAERERARSAAREEVERSIRQYCSGQPNGGVNVYLCNNATIP